jgi:hypothetical protein
VVKNADSATSAAATGAFTQLNRGALGDLRGSGANAFRSCAQPLQGASWPSGGQLPGRQTRLLGAEQLAEPVVVDTRIKALTKELKAMMLASARR